MDISAIEGSGYKGGCGYGFQILSPYDLSLVEVEYEYTVVCTDEAVVLGLEVVDYSGNALSEGEHYQLAYCDNNGEELSYAPADPGHYGAIIQPAEGSEYVGSYHFGFQILSQYDLSLADILFNGEEWPSSFACTGEPVDLGISVSLGGEELVEGVDYEVVYFGEGYPESAEPPSEAGWYNVAVRATEGGGCEGSSPYYYFEIYDPYDFSNAGVSISENFYLYTGEEIKPNVHVWLYEELTEGVDYTVEFKNNTGSPTNAVTASVLVTPVDPYYGESVELSFTIAPFCDLSTLLETGNLHVAWEGSSMSPDNLSFLIDDRPITPAVVISVQDEKIIQGEDFTVKYIDSEGAEISPLAAGEYGILVTGTENGTCRGEVEIPFSIVSHIDLSQYAIFSPQCDYTWSDDGRNYIIFADDLIDVSWRGYVYGEWNTPLLVEGYDYERSVSYDESTGLYTAAFTGKGLYTGTFTQNYSFDNPDNVFEHCSWWVNGKMAFSQYGSAEVTQLPLNVEGDPIDPIVTNSTLANGHDFELVGYVDSDGDAVSSFIAGDTIFLSILGVGEYEGCSMLLPVEITPHEEAEDQIIEISKGCVVEINANYAHSSKESYPVWLKSNEESPEVRVYDGSWNPLVEGTHFTKTVSRDDSAMTIVVSAIEGSGYSGSVEHSVQLVDQYNLNDSADFYGETDYQYPEGASCDLLYELWGYDGPLKENVDFKLSLVKSDGTKVDELGDSGWYTLVASGLGDWTGEITLDIQATEKGVGELSLRYADVSASEKYVFTDSEVEPEIEVSYCGYTLTEDDEYTVEYFNNDAIGNAYLVITAVEGSHFCGSRAWAYEIVESYTFDSAELWYYDELLGDYEYYRPGSLPTISLGENGEAELDIYVEDYSYQTGESPLDSSYYEVTYGNNTEPGIAWVKVTGKNGFTGDIKANFIVVEGNSSDDEGDEGDDPEEPVEISIPSAKTGLTYTGAVQTGVAAGEGYELSGASAASAGSYVATATLEEGYAWSDGSTEPKSIEWSIAKATLTATYAGERVSWDGEPALKVSVAGFVGGETARTAAGYVAPKVSAPGALEPGRSYTLAPSGGKADNYAFKYASGRLAVGSKPDASATRLSGDNALGTMASIVREGFADGSASGRAVVVATVDGYWDALAASSLAGANGTPVLLTDPASLSPQTRAEIVRLGASRVYIAGGTAAVSPKVERELRSLVGASNVERLAGANALETAVRIYEEGRGSWGKTAFVATAGGYWDALAASPYAYAQGAPVFLADPSTRMLDPASVAAIRAGGFERVVLCGGTAVVSDGVKSQLPGVRVTRLGGANAYETAAKIAGWCLDNGMEATAVGVATGDGYWDALTGASLCGAKGGPLVLVGGGTGDAAAFLAANRGDVVDCYVFGGTAAVTRAEFNAVKAALG